MTIPDEVAALVRRLGAYHRSLEELLGRVNDPNAVASIKFLLQSIKQAKEILTSESLSPPAGIVMPMSGAVYSSVHDSEDTCLTCGKTIPIPNQAYGINPDALCVCCRHDRRPSRLSARERKE